MLVMPDFSGVENLTKGISGFNGVKPNLGLQSLQAEKRSKALLNQYDKALKRDAFLKERIGKT